jgi:hypothetical protein
VDGTYTLTYVLDAAASASCTPIPSTTVTVGDDAGTDDGGVAEACTCSAETESCSALTTQSGVTTTVNLTTTYGPTSFSGTLRIETTDAEGKIVYGPCQYTYTAVM